MIPKHYQAWRKCIEVDCRISITRTFLEERLSVFQNPNDAYVKEFEALYGADYRLQVVAWFQQALAEEMGASPRLN